MKTIKRLFYSEHGIKSNILICVSKQQNPLKCNQFIQEDLSSGIFGLISHAVIQGQERWWNCQENSRGTRESLDKICLDKFFDVLKESLVVIKRGCGNGFYISGLDFAVISTT